MKIIWAAHFRDRFLKEKERRKYRVQSADTEEEEKKGGLQQTVTR